MTFSCTEWKTSTDVLHLIPGGYPVSIDVVQASVGGDGTAMHFVLPLRAHNLPLHNRCLPDGEKLWAHATAGAALGEISFTMPARDEQKSRKVRQQLWAREVNISNGKAGTISATCVVAREIDAPKAVKPIEWRLLTNRAAPTLDDAIELIDWYRARWEIEIYFDILKNGCKVEALQLSAIDRIERALALFMIVAWRVAYLMRAGRTCPDPDAALFFDPDEIRGAYLLSKKPQPTEPPASTRCYA